ncbi:MAG: sigma 54-interacting transcriptional regulator [Deltaproteobacteria bacterium]|nr:sigma 54-interacting transcriptional regulator [Deltaproteobacteria bacterium]
MPIFEAMNPAPTLNRATVELVRREGAELEFAPGEVLLSRDRPARFFIVLSGEVEIRLEGSEHLSLVIEKLGPGGTLGERAILGGRSAPTVAAAVGSVRVLTFPPQWLLESTERLPALRTHVLASLAHRYHGAHVLAWELYRKGKAAERIARSGVQSGVLITRSAAMKEVDRKIAAVRGEFVPLLIMGERGTGKTFVATKVYEAACESDSPFIAIDSRQLDGESGTRLLFGGPAFEPHPTATTEYGAIHLAHGGVLVLRHIESLPPACQTVLLEYLQAAAAGGEGYFPRTRVLCTSRQNLSALSDNGRFHTGLAAVLLRHVIRVPNMEERRRDIPDLTQEFLQERQDGSTIAKDAAAVLYSREYPAYHAGELKGVVSFAAVMAKGEPIRAQHVIGERRVYALDVDPARTSGVLRWLTMGAGVDVLRGFATLFFAGVILATLLAPEAEIGRAANGLVWGLWEPLLIVSFLCLGRLWCAVCPLAVPGLALQKHLGLRLKVPAFLREREPYLAALGIVLICLSGHAFEMKVNPVRTGLLLLTLAGLASVSSLAFERHGWCQHLCPMGALAGSFANLSSIRVWANPWLCMNRCAAAYCLNGRDGREGCPTFHRPNQLTTLSQCKLCMNCLKVCPDQAVSLQLDLPLVRLWTSGSLDSRLVPALLSLVALSLFMVASDLFPATRTPLGLVLTALAAATLGLALTQVVNRTFRREAATDSSLPARIAGALLVLSWGALVADQLQHLPWLEVVRICVADRTASGILPLSGTHGVSAVFLLQVSVLLVGTSLSAWILRKSRARLRTLGGTSASWKWAALWALLSLHLAASIGLAVYRIL